MENADRNVGEKSYSVRFAYMSHEGEFRETVTFWLLTFLLVTYFPFGWYSPK